LTLTCWAVHNRSGPIWCQLSKIWVNIHTLTHNQAQVHPPGGHAGRSEGTS
jgi:hypothetical protein